MNDPRFLRGAELFDKRDFFEAHEVWEELWHDTYGADKNFVQGLIQVASAFHHFQNGNMKGARILHETGLELLKPYGAAHAGVDLDVLREKFSEAFREIVATPAAQLAGRSPGGTVRFPWSDARAFPLPRTNP